MLHGGSLFFGTRLLAKMISLVLKWRQVMRCGFYMFAQGLNETSVLLLVHRENVTSSEMVIALYKCACYKYQFIGNRTLESPDMMLHNIRC